MAKNHQTSESFQRSDMEKKLNEFMTKKFSKIDSISKTNQRKYIKTISRNTVDNIERWLSLKIPTELRNSIFDYIKNENWHEILESFNDEISYDTSHIRAKMTSSLSSRHILSDLQKLSTSSFPDNVIQGTSTFNQITLLGIAVGIANHAKKSGYKIIVIGFDNRVQSKLFATIVSDLFLSYGFKTNIFNNLCSTPELAFSVKKLNADLGIMITASHNDKRFNGIKIISKSSGPPNQKEKKKINNNIIISQKNLGAAYNFFKTESGINNSMLTKHSSIKKKSNLIKISNQKITDEFIRYIIKFISNQSTIRRNIKNLKIGFSAIHGTGYKPASKLFKKLGIRKPMFISSMIKPDSLFPLFETDQILEPGHDIVYEKIIDEFIKEYGKKQLENLDALLFTDPDSDRIGMICQTPKNEQKVFGKYRFVTGNELWTVVIWFYLQNLFTKHNLSLNTKNNLFVVKSFVTSDSIKAVCKKFHIKCIDGNVGFPELTNLVQKNLKKNLVNIGIFEESNGFTIAGNPNFKSNILSHILEKDGFLGIVKIIELLAYAKSKNSTFLDILNQLYTKHEIGYFHNFRSQIPENGYFDSVFENPEKDQILLNVEKFTKIAERYSKTKTPLKLGNLSISKVKKYPIAKNMHNTQNKFPFEGIRFFFNSSENHLTIRSSSTESKIRLFIQLKIIPEGRNLLKTKCDAEKISKKIIRDFKKILQN